MAEASGTKVPESPGVAVTTMASIGVPLTTGVAVTTTPPVLSAGVAEAAGAPLSLHPTSTNRRPAAATVKIVFFTLNLLLPTIRHTSTEFQLVAPVG